MNSCYINKHSLLSLNKLIIYITSNNNMYELNGRTRNITFSNCVTRKYCWHTIPLHTYQTVGLRSADPYLGSQRISRGSYSKPKPPVPPTLFIVL